MRFKGITVLILIFVFGDGAFGVRNPNVQSPVGRGVVPPSSYRSGLVRSVNPMGIDGNLIITGNIGGGKHFRGIVPYRSTSSFGVAGTSISQTSGTLDSFLRRSTFNGGSRGGLTPFYSNTGTVTMIRPGERVVLPPPSGSEVAWNVPYRGTLDRPKVLYRSRSGDLSFRPLTVRSSQMLEETLLHDAESFPDSFHVVMPVEVDEQEISYLDLGRFMDKSKSLELDLAIKYELLKKPTDELEADEKETEFGFVKEQSEQVDIYEQMRLKILELQEKSESAEAGDDKWGVGEGVLDKFKSKREREADEELEDAEVETNASFKAILTSDRARTILGEYESFASYADDKFNQHLRAGEHYLKQGKYYWAADAFTLAAIYKPGNPLAYAGKSHALFAAGEYMSSALFLSWALEIFPEYAYFNIDIVSMVGNRDTLEARLADVNEWLKDSDAGELHLIIGYVYYQMGRYNRALEALAKAREKMPESKAAEILEEAVKIADREF